MVIIGRTFSLRRKTGPLLELLRYIHLNPIRAHMIASPVEYPWSSHHAYVGQRHEAWVTTDFALALFHCDDDACLTFAVTRAALTSASRHRLLTRARAWIAHQAVTRGY